ncbi:hypothetical protein MK079_03385 [Candidatus Gracilibacteria bacterium]|nr:hypothetical protein [Candidatus Gracilibacteria bacterium]
MTKNKQYPYTFKQSIAYEIKSDPKANDVVKKYVSKNHTGYSYNRLKFSQNISKIISKIQKTVDQICEKKYRDFYYEKIEQIQFKIAVMLYQGDTIAQQKEP